jgi:uncharacterized membrane protein YphA (DoxX/SURF4 family)
MPGKTSTMIDLIKTGRVFYGICLAGLGIQQIQYGEFRPVIIPDWPGWLHGSSIIAYTFGISLGIMGAMIVLNKNIRKALLILGGLLLVFFFCFQAINQLFIIPYKFHLALWTDALKELTLSGGAFIMAGTFPRENKSANTPTWLSFLEKLIPAGRIFFSIMLVSFGIDHFLYTGGVSKLVPSWIPAPIFWTYFSGVALIGSGLAILIKFRLKEAAFLLSLMIFIWFLILHIPRAIATPELDKGNEITSVFESLGFSGIALVIAAQAGFRLGSQGHK